MDLNLVRVFVAVHESRSLTVAAERLFVTPSAVSQALGRLRQHFDDPLFERAAGEMRPTPRADSVFPGFRDALARIQRTLDDVHGFDPATSDRTYRIALSELGEIGWMPELFAHLHRAAPGVRIEVVALDPQSLPEWLGRGTVDVAVTPTELPASFERTLVKTQKYVVATSAAHWLAERTLTFDHYRAADHVDVASDSGAPLIALARQRAGLEIHPAALVQHFATVPQLLVRSGAAIATIPEAIADGWATTWPIAIHPLPFAMPQIELNLYRRQTTQAAAALDWLYDNVARTITGSAGDFAAIHADRL